MTDCTTSGSSRSLSDVDPTRSANRAVANLRSLREVCADAMAAPHALQNRDSSGFSWPHAGHARMREPYDTIDPHATVAAVKAAMQDRYGSVDVVEVRDVPKPEPEGGEGRVRVRAASANRAA